MTTHEPPSVALRNYITQCTVMQVSTAKPSSWFCWFAADSQLNLYFLSKTTREHSEYVMADSRVSGGILKSVPTRGPGQPVTGVYFEGTVSQVSGDDLAKAYDIFASRWAKAEKLPTLDQLSDPNGIDRLWCINPIKFTYYDEEQQSYPPRQVVTDWS